ncbi:MAG: DUF6048 family protein [Bacteroidales bacterium]
MKRISVFSFKMALCLWLIPVAVAGQDTIDFPLRLGVGAALYSPVSAAAGLYPRGVEINGFYDLNERFSLAVDGGFTSFMYENYNYRYENDGVYFRMGADYNLLNPLLARGRYYAGISLKYGITLFSHKAPSIGYENYWGSYVTSGESSFQTAHFLEASPGIRAEIFKNFFIGWSVNLRLLAFSGTGKHMRAVDVPGFGNGSKPISGGFNYYLSIRIPYRTKRVIYIKPVRETEEDETDPDRQNIGSIR